MASPYRDTASKKSDGTGAATLTFSPAKQATYVYQVTINAPGSPDWELYIDGSLFAASSAATLSGLPITERSVVEIRFSNGTPNTNFQVSLWGAQYQRNSDIPFGGSLTLVDQSAAAVDAANAAKASIDAVAPMIDAPISTSRHYKFTGAGSFPIPPISGGTPSLNSGGPLAATSGTPAWTYGAWSQVTAGLAVAAYFHALTLSLPATAVVMIMDVGIGAAASEQVISRFPFIHNGSASNFDFYFPLPFPLLIAANTRVAIRVASTPATVVFQAIAAFVNQTDLLPIT